MQSTFSPFIRRVLLSATSIIGLTSHTLYASSVSMGDVAATNGSPSSPSRVVSVLPENLNGQDFSNYDFSGRDLSKRSFKGGLFRNALFEGCQFSDNDWYNANLTRAHFTNKDGLRKTTEVNGISLVGVLGRVNTLRVNGSDRDVSLIPFSEAARYRQDADTLKGSDGAIAQFITAYLYETYGDDIQEALAYSYYSKAKTQLPEALNNLAWMHENRRGGAAFDLTAIYKYYTEAKDNYLRLHNEPFDRAEYNLLRCDSMYFRDANAMYALGNRYLSGIGVEEDPEESLYWFYKMIHQKGEESKRLEQTDRNAAAQLLYEIATIYSSGRFVPQDLVKHTQFINRAAKLGHPDAWLTLGECYEKGIGVRQNYERAFDCYTLALGSPRQARVANANRELGFLHERGCQDFADDGTVTGQTPKDLQKAFDHYYKAQQLGSQTSLFNAARLSQEVQLTPQQIGELRTRCLSTENKADGPIQFLIGTWYENGHKHGLVKKDLEKAIACYETARGLKIPNAATRLRFLDKNFSLNSQNTIPDYTRSLMDQMFRASEEVGQTVFNELRETPDVVVSEREVLHSPQKDDETVKSFLSKEEERTRLNVLRLNYHFIPKDPYLDRHKSFVKGLEATTNNDLDVIRDRVLAAIRTPNLQALLPRAELLRVFPAVMNRVRDSANTPILKSRVKRAYQMWVSGNVVHQTLSLDERKIRFAEFLYQNSNHTGNDRVSLICNDGVSGFLYDHFEREFLKMPDIREVGMVISHALMEYRRDFIQRHKNPLPGAEEEAREAIVLLNYRLNHPFGLGGQFDPPLYPLIGKGNDDLYNPQNVITRFLKGGEIQHAWGDISVEQWVEPFTPALCIRLVRSAFKEKLMLLQQQFIEKDPYLNNLYQQAFLDMESNEYFDPIAYNANDPSHVYTDKFFEYLLLSYGYLLPRVA